MRFVFNPFTNNLDAVSAGPQATDVQSLTGDDHVVVPANVATGNINVVGGVGIQTSGNAATNTLTITSISGTVTWQTISASQAMAVDNGYICIAPGGALSLSLPTVSAIGSILEINLNGATSFTITQAASQQIILGNLSTTAGIGGTLSSSQQGDSIRMVCSKANLVWNVLSSMGNLILV